MVIHKMYDELQRRINTRLQGDLISQSRVELCLENRLDLERDLSEFEGKVETYNFDNSLENLQEVEKYRTELMLKHDIRTEEEFKVLHLLYQVRLLEE
jgi:hypothetical protein